MSNAILDSRRFLMERISIFFFGASWHVLRMRQIHKLLNSKKHDAILFLKQDISEELRGKCVHLLFSVWKSEHFSLHVKSSPSSVYVPILTSLSTEFGEVFLFCESIYISCCHITLLVNFNARLQERYQKKQRAMTSLWPQREKFKKKEKRM